MPKPQNILIAMWIKPQIGQKPTNSKFSLEKVKPQSKRFSLGPKALTQNKHGLTHQCMTIVRGKNPV
jgi:hypothetical protein